MAPSPLRPAEPAASAYPTFESLRAVNQPAKPSTNSAKRLYWTLSGPLHSAISVLSSPGSALDEAREPLYDSTTDSWHEVALLPMSDRKFSSITVGVDQLNEWRSVWYDEHSMHTDPPFLEEGSLVVEEGWRVVELEGSRENGKREWRAVKLVEAANPGFLGEGAEWRIVESEEQEEGESDLLRCCGEEIPGQEWWRSEVLVVGTGEGGFVTVRDFVQVLHPWLLRVRNEIRASLGLMRGDLKPLGEETELLVHWYGLNRLRIQTKEDWIGGREGGSRMINTYQDTAEAAQRAKHIGNERDGWKGGRTDFLLQHCENRITFHANQLQKQ